MHLIDTTLFYASESGGVKRYLLAKHAWLRQHTVLRHSVLVPGPCDGDDGDGIFSLASPVIPFTGGYRWPWKLKKWARQLEGMAPDLIETGDPYGLAWTALDVGQRLRVPVVGFYHSDLQRFAGARLGDWCEPAVGQYVRRLYGEFKRVLAPSRIMADKLRALGVQSSMTGRDYCVTPSNSADP